MIENIFNIMLSMKKYKIARKYWSVKSVGYFCESTGLYGCFANFLKTRIKINFSLKYESEAGDSVGQNWPTASISLPPASLNQSHDSLFTVSSSVSSITFIGNATRSYFTWLPLFWFPPPSGNRDKETQNLISIGFKFNTHDTH